MNVFSECFNMQSPSCSVGLCPILKTNEVIIHKASAFIPVLTKLKIFTLDYNFVGVCKCMSETESRFPGSGGE